MYPPSTTSLHQPTGTDIRTQMVTTGSGPGDFDFRQDPFWARRHHLVTTGSSDTSDHARRALQYFRLLSSRRVTLRLYEAAPIAVQPHPAEMLRNIDEPDHIFFEAPCREVVAIWHKPFFLRLLLAAWKQVGEENFFVRFRNREAKRLRTEH